MGLFTLRLSILLHFLSELWNRLELFLIFKVISEAILSTCDIKLDSIEDNDQENNMKHDLREDIT